MSELRPIDAGGGAVYGVLRDGGGHFRHVVKFKPATTAEVAGSAANIIGAVAMQAQLAAIEKAIAEVAESVRGVQQTLDIYSAAKRGAISAVLEEAYTVSR